jgi:hypothetical protein
MTELSLEDSRAKIVAMLDDECAFSHLAWDSGQVADDHPLAIAFDQACQRRLKDLGIEEVTAENRFVVRKALCDLATRNEEVAVLLRPQDVLDAIELRAGRRLQPLPGKPLPEGERRRASAPAYLVANCAPALRFLPRHRAHKRFSTDPLETVRDVVFDPGPQRQAKQLAMVYLDTKHLKQQAAASARPDAMLAALTGAFDKTREGRAIAQLRKEEWERNFGRFRDASFER